MKERILTGWNFIRVLWLIMGIGIGLQAIKERNYLMLFAALYFAFSSLANIGCCATRGCATGFNYTNKKEKEITEVEFEEINDHQNVK